MPLCHHVFSFFKIEMILLLHGAPNMEQETLPVSYSYSFLIAAFEGAEVVSGQQLQMKSLIPEIYLQRKKKTVTV